MRWRLLSRWPQGTANTLKSTLILPLHNEHTRALTFENFCSGDGGAASAPAQARSKAEKQTATYILPSSRLKALNAGSVERPCSNFHSFEGAMAPAGSAGGGGGGGGGGATQPLRLPASKLAQGIRNGLISGGLQQSSAGGGHGSDAGGGSVGWGSEGCGSVLPSSALQRQLQDADEGKSGISEYELQRLKRMQVIEHHYSPHTHPYTLTLPSPAHAHAHAHAHA